jgi:pyridoxine 5'-phosphate synthase PdxJ
MSSHPLAAARGGLGLAEVVALLDVRCTMLMQVGFDVLVFNISGLRLAEAVAALKPARIAASLFENPAKTASAKARFLPVKAINNFLQGGLFSAREEAMRCRSDESC